jgi:4-deoxy-L-threo-5-hexosulose-uronate ketol-isomerase
MSTRATGSGPRREDNSPPAISVRPATDPGTLPGLTAAQLRARFLIESLFVPGRVLLTYSADDRMVAGGAVPVRLPLRVEPAAPIGAGHFLANREVGILHISGEPASVTIGGESYGESYRLSAGDLLYVGRGDRDIELRSTDPSRPARLYLVSTLAHRPCPTRKVSRADVPPQTMGAAGASDHCRVHPYIVPGRVESCSLALGVTTLEPGATWTTMPPHLHERRSEIILYFDLPAQGRALHLMGRPDETRHLVVANEQAVISPPWSIHTGAATSPHSICWAMAGETQGIDDVEPVAMEDLR